MNSFSSGLPPPPLFALPPPPQLDTPVLLMLGLSTPTCPSNNTDIDDRSDVTAHDLLSRTSAIFLAGVVIVVLIVLLMLFIVAACVVVRASKRQLVQKSRTHLMSHSSCSENSANTRSEQLFCHQLSPSTSSSASGSGSSSISSPKSQLNGSFIAERCLLANASASTTSSFCEWRQLPLPCPSTESHQYESIGDLEGCNMYFEVSEPRLVLSPTRLHRPAPIQQQVAQFNRINDQYLTSLIV